jgi:uncharacterized protein YfdQ (DUF2303 family)
MLNEKETELIIEGFFKECLAFWNRTVTDTREAFTKAIRDIEELTHDPYESCGKLIDISTRDKFVRYRKQDLNIFQI